MKNSTYFVLAAAIVSFTACGPNKKSTVINNAPAPTTQGGAFPQTSPTTTVPVGTETPQSQPGMVTAASGQNPAHGQPNHRCDIPVGAPLNSPASSQAPAATNATPTIAPPVLPAPSPTTPVVAAGMNPAHGQPGHDCAIPVGAPLAKK